MRRGNSRRYLMNFTYLVAIALATVGWLWLIVWIAKQVI
jgi:hypothetical protein